MILFFIISIYVNITKDTWDTLTASPEHKQAFVLCFAPWCSHCKANLPIFRKVAKDYENNDNIIIGTVNCTNERELCDKTLPVDGYPTFLTFYHGEMREIWFSHSEKHFRKVIDRLLKLENNNYFISEEKEEKDEKEKTNKKYKVYPTFEFNFPENDNESVEIASKAISSSDYYRDDVNYQMSFNHDNILSVTAVIGEDVKIQMEGNYTVDNIYDFIKDNQHQYLGNWTFQTVRRLNKKFVILATKDNEQYQKYKDFGKKYLKTHFFGNSISKPEDTLKRIFGLGKNNYPAVIYANLQKSEYAIIKNVKNEQEIEDFLQKQEEGQLSYSELDEYDQVLLNFYEVFKIVFIFIIVMVFILVSIILIYKKYFDISGDEKLD